MDLAARVEPLLRALTDKMTYGEMCERVRINTGNAMNNAQILQQALSLLAVSEQLQGADVEDQIDQKPGLLPFHLLVNKQTGEPGPGYYRWLKLTPYTRARKCA